MEQRIRQLAQSMSDPSFGMDEGDYFLHCKEVMADSGWTLMEIREACRVKYKWLRAEYLINKIRGGSGTAPAEAIIMLLEENFKP
jgi:hypothetical protein